MNCFTELLDCSICTEPFKDARFMSCAHTFCLCCISKLPLYNSIYIKCPTCRQVTKLPPAGVTGLISNFYIEKIKEALYQKDLELGIQNTTYETLLKTREKNCKERIKKLCHQQDRINFELELIKSRLVEKDRLLRKVISKLVKEKQKSVVDLYNKEEEFERIMNVLHEKLKKTEKSLRALQSSLGSSGYHLTLADKLKGT